MSEQALQPVEAINPAIAEEAATEVETRASEQELTAHSADRMRIVNMRNLDKHFMWAAENYAKADIIPTEYRNRPGNCFIALKIADRMNLDPIFVMQNLYVVKGKPSWSGQACIALINGCGLFKEGTNFEWVGKEGEDSFGCVCKSIKKSTGELLAGTPITMEMVHGEGWDSNKKWKTMTRQMLMYRAAAFFARVYCPNILMGFAIEGEAEDITTIPESTVVTINQP